MTADDFADSEETVIEIYPENWTSFLVFHAVRTQWRVGFAGATGLDYSMLPDVFRMMAVPRGQWKELFDDIRVMEREALTTMQEDR